MQASDAWDKTSDMRTRSITKHLYQKLCKFDFVTLAVPTTLSTVEVIFELARLNLINVFQFSTLPVHSRSGRCTHGGGAIDVNLTASFPPGCKGLCSRCP